MIESKIEEKSTLVYVDEGFDEVNSITSDNNDNGSIPSRCCSVQKSTNIDNKAILNTCKKYQPQQFNKLYLKQVARGSVNNVVQLLSRYKDGQLQMDPNYENKLGKNALKISIENCHFIMCRVLLENGVRVDIASIFYAIEHNYLKFAKLILEYDDCLSDAISNFSEELQGLFEVDDEEHDKHQLSWEAFVLKKIVYKALCSPKYITAVCEKEERDPFEFCMKLVKKIRQDIYFDADQKDFYKSLFDQVEGYMCALLDEIRSTTELNGLFNWLSAKSFSETNLHGAESKIYKRLQAQQLSLLEKACKQRLVKFVTHQNSQFILSKLLNCNTPILRWRNPIVVSIVSKCFGLLFFLWPLLYLIPPWTRLGGIMASPSITFECHLMSEITLLGLLLAYVETKSRDVTYLGAPPTCLEWLIFVWIIGKFVAEIQECRNRGLKTYLKDYWNHFDLIELLLFGMAITARAIDFFSHVNDENKVYREDWQTTDPRLISIGLLALAYVFTFMGVLCLTRANSFLGPLRVTLTKMLLNVLQFLVIFALLMLAFTVSLTELYWHQGTEEGTLAFCEKKSNLSSSYCPSSGDGPEEDACDGPLFTGIVSSLQNMFWALFGMLDLECFLNGSDNVAYIDDIGVFLVAIYHVSVIFILMNMLIAMMTKSFDRTSENKDAEWKFYRTELWIRFIRQDYSGPPPMNLLPDFYNIFLKIKKTVSQHFRFGSTFMSQVKSFDEAVKQLYLIHRKLRLETSKKLVQRYKTKHIALPSAS